MSEGNLNFPFSNSLMEVSDALFGRQEITEAVLLELMESQPVQRLKGIDCAGSTILIKKPTYSRFEHSLGDMLVLKNFKAPLEEQVAGLLHDVPHTAFSHVGDFVFDQTETMEYHDQFLEKLVMASEIPSILEKHGLNPARIVDESNFPLQENSLPDICADRIDYFLRTLCKEVKGFKQQAFSHLSNLRVHENKFILNDRESAKAYATDFMMLDATIWADPTEIASFKLLADAIKLAIQKGFLKEEDMFQDDAFVLNALKQSADKEISEILALLTPDFKVEEAEDEFDFQVKTKCRFVDPEFLENGALLRLSEVDSHFKELVDAHQTRVKSGYNIKIVR
jgi:HD superfamily phosphohydrolase